MTKKDIIDEISAEYGVHRGTAEHIINQFLLKISRNVAKGKTVKLMGFGSFLKRRRKSRIGSDPNTKKRKLFRSKNWPKFIPSQSLKEACK